MIRLRQGFGATGVRLRQGFGATGVRLRQGFGATGVRRRRGFGPTGVRLHQGSGETAQTRAVAQHAVLALLAFYKVVLSPFVGGGCRFVPSCSDYARDAVVKHGALRGGWLAVRRLSRCHPLGSHGFDPVP